MTSRDISFITPGFRLPEEKNVFLDYVSILTIRMELADVRYRCIILSKRKVPVQLLLIRKYIRGENNKDDDT